MKHKVLWLGVVLAALFWQTAAAADCDYCTAIQGTSPPYDETLALIANSNDLTKMALLYQGAIADIEETDDNGWTMLHWAVEVVNNENYGGYGVQYFNDSGVQYINFDEQVYQAAKVYMHKRANPNKVNNVGESALIRAVAKNDARMVNILLGNEVLTADELDKKLSAQNAFANTEQNNDDRIGAAPYVKNVIGGFSPLMYAVRHADFDIVQAVFQALTDAGGTVNDTVNDTDNVGNTALFHYAPRIDNARIGRALVLVNGINLTIVNNAGENILQHAIHHNNVSLVSDIILFHRDADAFDKFYNHKNADGNTPLILAAQLGRTEIVDLLITRTGISVNVINNNSRNAFIEAAYSGDVDILRHLYNHDSFNTININYRDNIGATPLLAAADEGHSAAVQFLLDIGADPNLPQCAVFISTFCVGTGNTPLLYAVKNNDNNTFLALAQNGADYDLANADGITPLILAANMGNRIAAKALLILGADYSLRDNNGLSALEHARSNNTDESRRIVERIRGIITGL